jgi:hypothetical protein
MELDATSADHNGEVPFEVLPAGTDDNPLLPGGATFPLPLDPGKVALNQVSCNADNPGNVTRDFLEFQQIFWELNQRRSVKSSKCRPPR